MIMQKFIVTLEMYGENEEDVKNMVVSALTNTEGLRGLSCVTRVNRVSTSEEFKTKVRWIKEYRERTGRSLAGAVAAWDKREWLQKYQETNGCSLRAALKAYHYPLLIQDYRR